MELSQHAVYADGDLLRESTTIGNTAFKKAKALWEIRG
jgi:hypothetical protein